MLDIFFYRLLLAYDTTRGYARFFAQKYHFGVAGFFFLFVWIVLNHDCITNQTGCLCNWPKSFIWFSIVSQIKITRNEHQIFHNGCSITQPVSSLLTVCFLCFLSQPDPHIILNKIFTLVLLSVPWLWLTTHMDGFCIFVALTWADFFSFFLSFILHQSFDIEAVAIRHSP